MYAAEGLMSATHDFIKIDDIKNGINVSQSEFNFEFYVFGTEEASVYFSPEPIGEFGARNGYGVCKFHKKFDFVNASFS